MKAQVAFLAFAQTLGEFGLALPQSLNSGEALLEELIKTNDEAARTSQREHSKQIPGAGTIHQQLKETEQIYMIKASRISAGVAHITEDKRAIQVRVPTTTSPYAEGITETGSLAYRIYFVRQVQPEQWEAVPMHEPVKTTEFDPEVHHITQTLGFWPELPSEPVRYGVVVEQIGDWEVTQEKQAGKERMSTSFANSADETAFLQALSVLPTGYSSLFYESMSNPNILTPFSGRLGEVLARLKEEGYEELLKAPMNTIGRYRTDRTSYAVAFCGRVGDQYSPGNLIPLGINLNARARVAGELMYTPDSLAEMAGLKYADLNERGQILAALGLDESPNSFEFFIHASTHISEGPNQLDGRIGAKQYTRDLFTRPYTPEESKALGNDTTVNLLEIAPVVKTEVTEGEKAIPKEEFDTLGKLLAYYVVLGPVDQGEILWDCPLISKRLKELKEEQESIGYRGLDNPYLGMSKGSPSRRGGGFRFGVALPSLGFGLDVRRGFGVSGTDFGESKYAGRTTLRSSGVSAQLDPIHIRLIVQY